MARHPFVYRGSCLSHLTDTRNLPPIRAISYAIIEQVHADPKNSALAHLPSVKFTANAAWLVLVVTAFNLSRAATTITGPGLAWSGQARPGLAWPPPRRSGAS